MTETKTENKQETKEDKEKKKRKVNPFVFFTVATLVFTLIGFSLLFHISFSLTPKWVVTKTDSGIQLTRSPEFMEIKAKEIEEGLADLVTPSGGAVIPVVWADTGKKLVDAGVIDREKFEALYERRGGLGAYEAQLLKGENNGEIIVNSENSNVILNLLWALGLANESEILEKGPMTDGKYGGDAGKFASTGGWTLAKGDAMDHYSGHDFISLNQQQRDLVEKVSKNIYRPCCGNSTYFPDCNHGMAMLGLMQLMASQGATEQEMYKAALDINSFWFPDTYMTIGKYFAKRGVSWDEINAKEVLGASYSSAQGYRQVAQEVEPVQSSGGGSCGV